MRPIFALILMVFPILSFSLNQDSLFKAIDHLPDTQKITIITEHTGKLVSSDIHQAKVLATVSYELAKKTNITYYKNLSNYTLAQCFFELGLMDSASFFLKEIKTNLFYYSYWKC